jgi:hypothetical protein
MKIYYIFIIYMLATILDIYIATKIIIMLYKIRSQLS